MLTSVYNDQNFQSFVDLNQSNRIVMRAILYIMLPGGRRFEKENI